MGAVILTGAVDVHTLAVMLVHNMVSFNLEPLGFAVLLVWVKLQVAV